MAGGVKATMATTAGRSVPRSITARQNFKTRWTRAALSIAREPDHSALLRQAGRQTSPGLVATDARIHSQRYAGLQHATDGERIHRAPVYSRGEIVREFFS